ncbi:MAG: signal recognition particle receptor subunit alpha, partial [Clostridiales bacterium]|nr:signal recognition particle receptor subunit alpha [Clostridiales bacterium]
MGFFDKLKQSLEKTKIALGITKVDENLLEELEEKLIMSDVGMTATDEIMQELKTRIKQDKIVDSKKVIEILKEQLEKILTKENNKINLEKSPAAILMVGV